MNEEYCQFCGKLTGIQLSNGGYTSSSCGCDGRENLIHSKTRYIIVTEGEFGFGGVIYITGREEAVKKYNELISNGVSVDVITLSQVIKTNI